jgi:hypothetical protein
MNKRFFYSVVAVAITIFFATCEKEDKKDNVQEKSTVVGKWAFVDRDGVTLEITDSKIMFLPVVENPTPIETRTYNWVSSDTIEITQRIVWSIGTTRSKVIFHTPDSVTIKNWFIGSTEVDAPIFDDVTIVRIKK